MKTIFWNVDTQYDFMRNDESFQGTLAIPGAREIEGNLEKLTKLARKRSISVVNTADWHNEYSKELSDTPDFKTTFPRHCIQGTMGAEYVPATKPLNPYVVDWAWDPMPYLGDEVESGLKLGIDLGEDIIILKDHFDVFQGNPFTGEILEILKPEMAVVYGVATNVCVNYAVLGLLERGIKVYVPTDAIKELPGLPLEEVLDNWKKKGAVLTTVDEIIKDLGGTK